MSAWWAGCGVFHAPDHALPDRTRATSRHASRVREVIALAVATHGQKRGVHRAAELLGIAERTVTEIQGLRTTGRTIPEARIMSAAITLRRDRAAQLRAELAQLEDAMDGADTQRSGASVAVAGR